MKSIHLFLIYIILFANISEKGITCHKVLRKKRSSKRIHRNSSITQKNKVLLAQKSDRRSKFGVDILFTMIGFGINYILNAINSNYISKISGLKQKTVAKYEIMMENSINLQIQICNFSKFNFFILNEEVNLSTLKMGILSIRNPDLFKIYKEAMITKLEEARSNLEEDQKVLCDVKFDFIGERRIFSNTLSLNDQSKIQAQKEKESKSFKGMLGSFTDGFLTSYVQNQKGVSLMVSQISTVDTIFEFGNKASAWKKNNKGKKDHSGIFNENDLKNFSIGVTFFMYFPEIFDFASQVISDIQGITQITQDFLTLFKGFKDLFFSPDKALEDKYGNTFTANELKLKSITGKFIRLLGLIGIVKSLTSIVNTLINSNYGSDTVLSDFSNHISLMLLAEEWIISHFDLIVSKTQRDFGEFPIGVANGIIQEKEETVSNAKKAFFVGLFLFLVGNIINFIKKLITEIILNNIPFLSIIFIGMKIVKVSFEIYKNRKLFLTLEKTENINNDMVKSFTYNVEMVFLFIYCKKSKEMAIILNEILNLKDSLDKTLISKSQNEDLKEIKPIITELFQNQYVFANKYFTRGILKIYGFDDNEILKIVYRISFIQKFGPITDFAPSVDSSNDLLSLKKMYFDHGFTKQDSASLYYCRMCTNKTAIVQFRSLVINPLKSDFLDKFERGLSDFQTEINKQLKSIRSTQNFSISGTFESAIYEEKAGLKIQILLFAFSELYENGVFNSNFSFGIAFYQTEKGIDNNLILRSNIDFSDSSISSSLETFNSLYFVSEKNGNKENMQSMAENVIQENKKASVRLLDYSKVTCGKNEFTYGMYFRKKAVEAGLNEFALNKTPEAKFNLEYALYHEISSLFDKKKTDQILEILSLFNINQNVDAILKDPTQLDIKTTTLDFRELEIKLLKIDEKDSATLKDYQNQGYLILPNPFGIFSKLDEKDFCTDRTTRILIRKILNSKNSEYTKPNEITQLNPNQFCSNLSICNSKFSKNTENYFMFAFFERNKDKIDGQNITPNDEVLFQIKSIYWSKFHSIEATPTMLPFVENNSEFVNQFWTLPKLRYLFDYYTDSLEGKHSLFCTHTVFDDKLNYDSIPGLRIGGSSFFHDFQKGTKVVIPDSLKWTFFFIPLVFTKNQGDLALELFNYFDPKKNPQSKEQGDFYRLVETISDEEVVMKPTLKKIYYIETLFGDDFETLEAQGYFSHSKFLGKLDKSDTDFFTNTLFPFISLANLVPYAMKLPDGTYFSSADYYMRRPAYRTNETGGFVKSRIAFRVWVSYEPGIFEAPAFCPKNK